MTVELSVRRLAGSLILLSMILAYFVSQYWILLAAFVGLNLFQSSFTKFCPAEIVIKKLFFKDKSACCSTSIEPEKSINS